MDRALIIKTTNNINIAKFATFIIGINFILGRFYELTYMYTIGLDPRKLNLALLDYIRTGIDLLPITVLFIFYSLFSIKPGEASKFLEKNPTIKSLHSSFILRKICDFWIPEVIIIIIFLVYSLSIFTSVTFLIFLFITPVLIYLLYKKKIEKIIKARISYAHSLLIKFVLILISLFTIMGVIDGRADQYHSKKEITKISLRTPNNLTVKEKLLDDDVYTFEGYVMRSFDRVTIFDVNGKIVVVNNWEMLNIAE